MRDRVSYPLNVDPAEEQLKEAMEELQWSEARFKLLSDIAGRLLATTNPQGLVNDVCREVMERLHCQVFFNFLIDKSSSKLHLNACGGLEEAAAAEFEWMEIDATCSICGAVACGGNRIVAENIQQKFDANAALVKALGIQAYCCHPLRIEGKLIGTLSFGTATRPQFNDNEIEIMRTVSDQVATALHRISQEKALRDANAGLDRRVQERTSELEATYRTAPVGLAVLDRQLRCVRVNERFAEICGYSSALHIGRPLGEMMPGLDEKALSALQKIIETGEPLRNIEFRVQPSGGPGSERVWYQSWFPLRDENGRITGINGVVEEITEYRRAEKRIADERMRFKDALDGLPAYLILLSPDYHVDFANRYFEERFGKSDGRRCYEYLFNRTEPCENCESFKVLKTNKPHRWEWNGPDNRLYDIHDFLAHDVDGSMLVMEVGIDITEQRRAEKDLRLQSEQLRNLASQLTLAEQRERLRLAQVLHDGLQQNLVAAILQMRLIEKSGARDVHRAAATVSGILSESIEMSRSLTLELSPPILREGGLVPALEWLSRWMQDRQDLKVGLVAIGELRPISEDVTVLLFQAVRELLFNVVKHSGVKIAGVQVDQQPTQIRVTVADEGSGFDVRCIQESGPGSEGFGLASIRHRLDFLDGKMEIQSEPGVGTQVVLTVALSGTESARASSDSAPRMSGEAEKRLEKDNAGHSSKIRIVLADDHPVMRQGLAGLLRDQPDMDIVGEAADGQSVIRLVEEVCPDVVLMDISMPGINGIEATRIIHSKLPDVQVIGLTMFEEEAMASAIRKAGAVNCLTKSDSPMNIIEAIRACRPS